MPVVTSTRGSTPDERAVISRRMEPQRRGTSTALRSHSNETARLAVMFGVAAAVLGGLLVKWPSGPLGFAFAMALLFAVMSVIGKLRSRQLTKQEMGKLVAIEADRERTIAEVCFAAERILVVSGDYDGEVWWLFRADDGKWLFLSHEQWEDFDPSAFAWKRDVRFGVDRHQAVVSFASDGPPIAVERRDLQPPDFIPRPDTLFWSPPEDQDPRSLELAIDPTTEMAGLPHRDNEVSSTR